MRTTSAASERSDSGRRFPPPSSIACDQKLERLVEKLDRLEERVGESRLERLLRVQHAVLAERVLDDEAHRLLGPYEPRDELRPAPARNEPEQHLGAGEVANVRRQGAVVAVERDLDSSAKRGAVDRRKRDERQLAQPAEELVPGFAALRGRARA